MKAPTINKIGITFLFLIAVVAKVTTASKITALHQLPFQKTTSGKLGYLDGAVNIGDCSERRRGELSPWETIAPAIWAIL